MPKTKSSIQLEIERRRKYKEQTDCGLVKIPKSNQALIEFIKRSKMYDERDEKV